MNDSFTRYILELLTCDIWNGTMSSISKDAQYHMPDSFRTSIGTKSSILPPTSLTVLTTYCNFHAFVAYLKQSSSTTSRTILNSSFIMPTTVKSGTTLRMAMITDSVSHTELLLTIASTMNSRKGQPWRSWWPPVRFILSQWTRDWE